jgi:hypothetical protein
MHKGLLTGRPSQASHSGLVLYLWRLFSIRGFFHGFEDPVVESAGLNHETNREFLRVRGQMGGR